MAKFTLSAIGTTFDREADDESKANMKRKNEMSDSEGDDEERKRTLTKRERDELARKEDLIEFAKGEAARERKAKAKGVNGEGVDYQGAIPRPQNYVDLYDEAIAQGLPPPENLPPIPHPIPLPPVPGPPAAKNIRPRRQIRKARAPINNNNNNVAARRTEAEEEERRVLAARVAAALAEPDEEAPPPSAEEMRKKEQRKAEWREKQRLAAEAQKAKDERKAEKAQRKEDKKRRKLDPIAGPSSYAPPPPPRQATPPPPRPLDHDMKNRGEWEQKYGKVFEGDDACTKCFDHGKECKSSDGLTCGGCFLLAVEKDQGTNCNLSER